MEENKAKAYFDAEMTGYVSCSEEEIRDLIDRMNPENEAKLIEGCQYMVKEAADFYASKQDVPYMDLIQEGNLGLILAIRDMTESDDRTVMRLEAAIRDAMEKFLEQESDNAKINEKIRAYMNVLDDVCVNFAKEHGRQATAEEVADIMKMDVSDVKYLMKIALNALDKEA